MDICTKTISDKFSSVGQFGLRNTPNLSYCPIFWQLVMQTFRPCCVQHANGWVIVGQCFVKLSNIWTLTCPTVQLLVYSVSNSPMSCELSVKQSNGRTVLFSNCPTVGQSCVQLSKCRIMLYQTVQWLDSAVSNHV